VLLKLVIPGTAGLLGLYLSSKIGFKGILNDEIKQIKNLFLVIFVGIIMGVYFIGYETFSHKIFTMHILLYEYSRIPSAIFASLSEGIGDQILQMLSITLFVWFFSKSIKSESGRNKLFWVVAIVCALGFAIKHIPVTAAFQWRSYRYMQNGFFYMALIVMGLYAPLALVCAYFFKRFGLLSAVIIHFITDISWRVLWSYIKMGDFVFRE
jgi:hypothetical protein